jgi:hypothetical protein
LYQVFLLWLCVKLDWPYIAEELPSKIGENVEGRINVTGRRRRRRRRRRSRKQLLDYLKETRGYCKLKEEAIDGTVWRNDFGRGYGTAIRL